MSTTLVVALLAAALAAWRIWIKFKPKSRSEKAAERELRRVLRHYAGGVWMIDNTGFTTFANAEIGRLLGSDADYLPGKHFRDFLRSGDGEEIADSMSVSALAATRNEEYKLAGVGGELVPCLLTGATLFDQAGRSTGALLWVSDLSERVRLAKRVERQKGLLQGMTESSSVAIAASDRHGLISYANPAIATLVGVGKQDMIGKTWGEVLGERATEFAGCDQDVVAGGNPAITMFTFGGGESARTYRFAVNALRDDNGDVTGVVRMGRDVTDELRDQRFLTTFRQIFESLRDAAVVVDRSYCLTHINRQWSDLLGHDIEQLLGKPIAEVLGNEIFERDVKSHVDDCLAGKESSRAIVQRNYGGKVHTRDVMYFPIRQQGEVDSVVILSRNISELFKTGDLAKIDEADEINRARNAS